MSHLDQIRVIVNDSTAEWQRTPGADEASVAALVKGCDFRLPVDYLDFLRCSNGGAGQLPVQSLWFGLWPAEDVLDFNRQNERDAYFSELFLIGSCDGNLFALEMKPDEPWPVIALDYLDSKRESVHRLSRDFLSFLLLIGREAK